MATQKVRYRFGYGLKVFWHRKKALLFFDLIGKFGPLSLPHNRQVPCSSQRRASISLTQIIELLQTHRLIDFGSLGFCLKTPDCRKFCTQSPAVWFSPLPITGTLGRWNLPEGATVEQWRWLRCCVLDNCKPVSVNGGSTTGNTRDIKSQILTGINASLVSVI